MEDVVVLAELRDDGLLDKPGRWVRSLDSHFWGGLKLGTCTVVCSASSMLEFD